MFSITDGESADYFVTSCFRLVVDFILLPNAFDEHLTIKEHFMIYAIFAVNFFEEYSVLWITSGHSARNITYLLNYLL